MERTCDPEVLRRAIAQKPDINIDVDEWIAEPKNIALATEDGSVGMFAFEYPGLYSGHYFFSGDTRGRKAIALANKMLDEIFNHRGAEAIRGLTPLQNLAAKWMTRRLGFKSYGVAHFPVGPCEIFILTRDQFNNRTANE